MGKCKLCLAESADLRESHFLPAFALKRTAIDPQTGRYSHPVAQRNGIASENPNPLKAKALCPSCEDLIKKNGEDYASRVSFQENGTFPLREELQNIASPGVAGCFSMPSLNSSTLAYFAISVFWRSSIWNEFYPEIKFSLPDARREQFRKWLLDPHGSPAGTELLLTVIDTPVKQNDAEYGQMVRAPTEVQNSEAFQARFLCAGLVFDLFISDSIPARLTKVSLLNGMAHIAGQHETGIHQDLLRSISATRQSKNLVKKLKSTV